MMLYSLTTKYSVIALVELARQDGQMRVKEIAEARGIPPHFLAKLVPPLVRAGILASMRGKTGGISFARDPSEVSLADVVRVIEGDGYFEECVFELDPCPGRPGCPLHDVWDPLRDEIIRFLEETTIGSVADKLDAAKEEQ
ncbi:MAG TPA: Rrf2 family transcriptional regulator [Candidatus Acetothermia bacterium]|nr:Rrf2 family transcriptional regulator [Candidatus Acetothermia bacterium]